MIKRTKSRTSTHIKLGINSQVSFDGTKLISRVASVTSAMWGIEIGLLTCEHSEFGWIEYSAVITILIIGEIAWKTFVK